MRISPKSIVPLSTVGLLLLVACGSEESPEISSSGASAESAAEASEASPLSPEQVYTDDLVTSPGWAVFQAEDPVAAVTEVEGYSTLDDQARASSTVLRGRIRKVESGRVFGSDQGFQVVYVTMYVEPELVLAGEDPVLTDGLVRVEFPLPGVGSPEDAPPVLEQLAPLEEGEPTVFYLRHKAEEAQQLGWSDAEVAAETGYYRLVASTGLVVSNDGIADAVLYLPSQDNPPIVQEIESEDVPTVEQESSVD